MKIQIINGPNLNLLGVVNQVYMAVVLLRATFHSLRQNILILK